MSKNLGYILIAPLNIFQAKSISQVSYRDDSEVIVKSIMPLPNFSHLPHSPQSTNLLFFLSDTYTTLYMYP